MGRYFDSERLSQVFFDERKWSSTRPIASRRIRGARSPSIQNWRGCQSAPDAKSVVRAGSLTQDPAIVKAASEASGGHV
jgi:hypothetical protein